MSIAKKSETGKGNSFTADLQHLRRILTPFPRCYCDNQHSAVGRLFSQIPIHTVSTRNTRIAPVSPAHHKQPKSATAP